MQSIHPKAPSDRRAFPDPETSSVSISVPLVLKALKSFNNCLSGGLDCLRPQHLKDLVSIPTQADAVLSSITQFINLLVRGICPLSAIFFFFGGRSVAMAKKGGGVRPIAVDSVWRRLASKCALSLVFEEVKKVLHPLQLGVWVKGEVEAAIHSVRSLVNALPDNWSLLKVDFINAFNTLRRDSLLEAVKSHCPGIYNYCLIAYGYRKYVIDL